MHFLCSPKETFTGKFRWAFWLNNLVIIAVLLVVPGPAELINTISFVRKAVSVTGTIGRYREHVSDNRRPDGSYKTIITPEFIFHSSDGRKIRFFDANIVANRESYPLGGHFTILYNPNSPEQAKVAGIKTVWVPVLWHCAIHIVFILIFLLGLCDRIYRKFREI